MKKKLWVLVVGGILSAAQPLLAYTGTVGGYTWTYRINGDVAEIYNGSQSAAISPKPTGAVAIPSTLGGKPVTSIGSYAFYGCSGLTSVTIPNSVTSIGSHAFDGCSGLTSVTIPNSVTNIAGAAFQSCSGLANVTIPNSVTNIEQFAFSRCSGLTSVAIPNSVTSIGDYAFSSCSGLTSVTIPDSVTSIGSSAFNGCRGLTSMTISASVTNIGEGAFGDSVKEYFEVAADNPAYKSDSGMLLTKDGKTLVAVPYKATAVTIPDSVTSIGGWAFRNCRGLTSVTIPNSVTSIESYAFYGCSGLTSVTIPNSVTSIGSSAFEDCSGLTSVTIPNSVTSIGAWAFEDCSGLTSVTILNSLTRIGLSAFSGCSGLTSVTIPKEVCSSGLSRAFPSAYKVITNIVVADGVTSIGSSAFSYCSSLTSVTIPNSVTNIGGSAFSYCPSLTSVVFKGNAPDDVGNSAFSSVGTGCTAYVKKGSTGWGVEIPGKWNELNIQYMTPEIEWLADRNLAADMRAANGRTAAECYALGLDPAVAADDFRITSFSMAGDEPQVEWEPKTNRWTGVELNAVLKGAESLEGPWMTVPSGGDPTFRFFKVEVTP